MIKSQKGFAVVETFLMLVVVTIIGGTGWYLWHTKTQSDKSLDNAANTTVKPTSKIPKPNSQKYLTIKEWDLQITLGTADPSVVTYKLNNSDSCLAGPCDGHADLSL